MFDPTHNFNHLNHYYQWVKFRTNAMVQFISNDLKESSPNLKPNTSVLVKASTNHTYNSTHGKRDPLKEKKRREEKDFEFSW